MNNSFLESRSSAENTAVGLTKEGGEIHGGGGKGAAVRLRSAHREISDEMGHNLPNPCEDCVQVSCTLFRKEEGISVSIYGV